MKQHPSPAPPPERDPYLVESVWRACDVLEAFREADEALTLSEIARRAALSAATAFRLVHTLSRRGLLERADSRRYRLALRPLRRPRYRIGYAGESEEFAFCRDVAASVEQAARREGVQLLALDNRYSEAAALRNVGFFIRERVDLVIEFQVYERIAGRISSELHAARIPMIAVEIPHPGAVYFGADNYGAGLMGGRALARWVQQNWGGRADEVLLLELPEAGVLPNSRLDGALTGLQRILGTAFASRVIRLPCFGQFDATFNTVRRYLQHSRPCRTLVVAINDPSAVGAIRAFEECGRSAQCAVLSHNGSLEGRLEMRRPGSRLVASVAFFPESYGAGVISLALDMLSGKAVPPAVFVKHAVLTRDNIDRFYPNDRLLEESFYAARARGLSAERIS